MPSIADLTVKKADGTTNVVYVAQQPSAGDGMPARWRQDAFSTIMGNRPVFAFSAKSAKGGSQKVCEARLDFPEIVTDSTTGVQTVRLKNIASAAITIEQSASQTTGDETAAQFANLLASALIQSCLKSGVAPT